MLKHRCNQGGTARKRPCLQGAFLYFLGGKEK